MSDKISWKQDTLKLKRYADIKVKCKHCGHSNVMPVYVEDRICSWCKRKIQNDSKGYFMYKLRKQLEGENNG